MSITFILGRNGGVNATHISTAELGMTLTTGGAQIDKQVSIASATGQIAFTFLSTGSQPNSAQWLNAVYTAQFDCSSAGADITWGLANVSGAAGHFGRYVAGGADETIQAGSLFAGTGIKIAQVTWAPAAGSTADQFELCVAAFNAGVMGESMSLTVENPASCFAIWQDTSALAVTNKPARTRVGWGI